MKEILKKALRNKTMQIASALMIALSSSSAHAAVEHWSVDFNPVPGIHSNPVSKSGPDAQFGLGNVWNNISFSGHQGSVGPTTTPLVDADGDASSVSLSWGGTISGWANASNANPDTDILNDYIFVNAGNADPSTTWSIDGLVPGQEYDLYLYGGIGRQGQMNLDGDGDGVNDFVGIAPAGGGAKYGRIKANAGGSILGDLGTLTAGEENWGGFQLVASTPIPPAAPPNALWSVDIQASGGTVFGQSPVPNTMNGMESNYLRGDVWNDYSVPAFDNVTPAAGPAPTLNLVDSHGNATNVTFQIKGTTEGWGGAGGAGGDLDLIRDYAFVDAGNVAGITSMDWEITGLDPSHVYELYAYGGVQRDMLLTVDLNGDQVLNEAGVIVNGSGELFASISPDPTGKIIGRFANGTGDPEGNFSGFQLLDVTVIPEPASLGMMLMGGLMLMRRRSEQ